MDLQRDNIMTDRSRGEIVLYNPDESIRVEVLIESETVWLNRQQMAQLFDRDIKTIGKHVNNALKEELQNFPVVAKFATTATDGKTYNVEYYSLDMILSVGYRVKSQRGIQFRIWSNQVLKEYLLRGYAFNQLIEKVERFTIETNRRLTVTEYEISQLKKYVELILSDYNDINEDTRIQLELINETLAELQSKKKEAEKPRIPIGYAAIMERRKNEEKE